VRPQRDLALTVPPEVLDALHQFVE
jgi:hypothetical protein